MTTIAIYPGTFDPITLGHVDLIARAATLFDKVIVAIAANENKQPLFSLTERVALTTSVLTPFPNVSVEGFNNLLLEFAKMKGAKIILRGLRGVSDFDFEFQMANVNHFLNPELESLFLMPREKYLSISSTLVREIAKFKGDVSGLVPSNVALALKKKWDN